ncbi:ABC transporter permease [Phytoactinopolyspora mesophila]|uniref:FtsX-like permease family protein n=1 Tax=Phytoactinopolyspora mesophila TaxID=2650750 RepID=A0A7K3M510_9ACTN|nr:ABC transporter permease [Phytoactinopolyspora mesophila]NDL58022.1 FtsX-like permease family protein [Phytoactinopolyspora mesophila]
MRFRFTFRDLLGEALAGVAARPSRLILTTLGTVLGVAALVSTMGLGQTASGQITDRFDAVAATRVVVEAGERDGPDGSVQATQLPWDATERVDRLAGVAASGTFARVDVGKTRVRGIPVVDPAGGIDHDIPVMAGSPGLFDALNGVLSTGRFFDSGHDERGDELVVLGRYAAERLGITRVESQPTIFIGERPFTVAGILDTVSHRTELLDAVIMPMGTASSVFGLEAPEALEIRTVLGAAQLVGGQAPLAVSPNNPSLLSVEVPPRPGSMREDVSTDVNAVFLALGGLALLVGGLGIANITLLSVMERVSEIGLRRSVGAARRHIAGQFVAESVVIGFLGGLVGAAAGVLVTVGVSALRDWTPLLDYRLAGTAPLLGALIGLVAGMYPAWRASTIEPITALRSG